MMAAIINIARKEIALPLIIHLLSYSFGCGYINFMINDGKSIV